MKPMVLFLLLFALGASAQSMAAFKATETCSLQCEHAQRTVTPAPDTLESLYFSWYGDSRGCQMLRVDLCQSCQPGNMEKCPAGLTCGPCDVDAKRTCHLCAPGTYSPEGEGACTHCPAGKVSGFGHRSGLCEECPAGKRANPSATECTSNDHNSISLSPAPPPESLAALALPEPVVLKTLDMNSFSSLSNNAAGCAEQAAKREHCPHGTCDSEYNDGMCKIKGLRPPIFIPKHQGMKCTGAIRASTALDRSSCEAIAAVNGHEWFSYSASTGQCLTTPACQGRATAPGFDIYKAYQGSFNATHAEMASHSSECSAADECYGNTQMTYAAVNNGCRTQISIRNPFNPAVTKRNHVTCTSCMDNHAFMMVHGFSRTGSCTTYNREPEAKCASLTSDQNPSPRQLGDEVVCTKAMLAVTVIANDGRMKAADVFGTGSNDKAIGLNGQSVSKCEVRKETVCKHGACSSQKRVVCVEVCKLKNWPDETEDCDPALCQGNTDVGHRGSMACAQAAMLS